MAYSKPLLEAVPTKSGAAVGIKLLKRQQLKAETQGQNANQDTKEKYNVMIYHVSFSVKVNLFQMKGSHHLVCLSNAIVMEIRQINTSTYSFVVLQAFCWRAVAKNFLHNFHQEQNDKLQSKFTFHVFSIKYISFLSIYICCAFQKASKQCIWKPYQVDIYSYDVNVNVNVNQMFRGVFFRAEVCENCLENMGFFK